MRILMKKTRCFNLFPWHNYMVTTFTETRLLTVTVILIYLPYTRITMSKRKL